MRVSCLLFYISCSGGCTDPEHGGSDVETVTSSLGPHCLPPCQSSICTKGNREITSSLLPYKWGEEKEIEKEKKPTTLHLFFCSVSKTKRNLHQTIKQITG